MKYLVLTALLALFALIGAGCSAGYSFDEERLEQFEDQLPSVPNDTLNEGQWPYPRWQHEQGAGEAL